MNPHSQLKVHKIKYVILNNIHEIKDGSKKQLTLYFSSDKICSVAAEKAETKIKESRRTGDCENFQKESEKVLDKNEYPLYNG